MRPVRTMRRAALLTGAALLALPAAAFAHGSVFEVTAKVVADPTKPTVLTDQTQYVVTNHGFTYVLKEDNGRLDHGMINYKVLPSAYRKTLTKDQILATGDTGAQPHATCAVASLETTDAIYAWQGADPFYGYVPWQTTSAGLEDDPAKWLPVVQSLTGVDLTKATDPAAACTGIGGTYYKADGTVSTADAFNSGLIEEKTGPLEEEIGQLTAAKAAADQALATAQATINQLLPLQGLTAQVAELKEQLTPLSVKLDSKRVAGTKAAKAGLKTTVTGPQGRKVKLSLVVDAVRAKALGLRSATLATKTVTIGAGGSAEGTLKPTGKAAAALRGLDSALPVWVDATSGDRASTAKGRVTG